MSDRLIRMRKRFGITPERHGTPPDLAVRVCAGAMTAMKDDPDLSIGDAVTAGFGSLSFDELHRLRLDANLNVVLGATVLGMMNCLTTEWHS